MNRTAIRVAYTLFGLASILMIALNLLTDRGSFWAIWPIWAFAMLAGAAIGAMRLHPHELLGIWLGGGGFLIAGLVVLDISNGGNVWAFWPAGVWIILSALFTTLNIDLLATIPTHPPRHNDDISPS